MLIGIGLFLVLWSITRPDPFGSAWWLLLIGCALIGSWLNDVRRRIG